MPNTTAPSLDASRRIPARLSKIGVTLSFLGRCVGLSSGEISQLFSTRKRLTNDKAKPLLAMVGDLEMVCRVFSPCPVLFKDHELILDVIRQLKGGSLVIGKSYLGGPTEVFGQNIEGWDF